MKSLTKWRLGYFIVVFGFVFWAYGITKTYGYNGIAIYCLGVIIGMGLISGLIVAMDKEIVKKPKNPEVR